MNITEKDRLDLRQELERIFQDPRLAEIAMDAMPPIDYEKFATRTDIESLRAVMDGRFDKIDGQFAKIAGRFAETDARITTVASELHSALATQMRLMLAAQIGTIAIIVSYISAVT